MSLIRNSKQIKQVIDFTGIENNKIHPCDIDAVLEFNNEILILIEVKFINSNIPTGQRLLLERICNSWHTNKCIILKVEHNFINENENIPLNKCFVKKCYYKKQWRKKNVELKIALNKLGHLWNCKKLNFKL